MYLRYALPLFVLFFLSEAVAQSANDGRLFDQGREMTERSPRAPEALDQLVGVTGQWDVEVTYHPTDSTTHIASGLAEFTFMNRGWSLMERLHVDDFDGNGNANDAMAFMTFNPTTERYELGEASSFTEHISVYDGVFENDRLVLTTAERRRGGGGITTYRIVYTARSNDRLSMVLEESTNFGRSWKPLLRREYSRRTTSSDFMSVQEDYGTATSTQPDEARQFDFLLGEWTANHNILLGGNWIQYPTNTTAVFVMGGHAILEHNWFNLDTNHPEAATSIIRLYNRAERRWESLYLNNRSNSLLHFGGVWENDQMVLHSFNTRLTDTISRWVFHSFEPDRYQWFAESSTDRGATFNETWTIDVVRK